MVGVGVQELTEEQLGADGEYFYARHLVAG
jgi:hypothetical protein